jgi:hypothetical protein
MVMNKQILIWKDTMDGMKIDPAELQSYLDQGWKEVGWIVCEPSNLAGDTYSHLSLETSSDAEHRGQNEHIRDR